MRKYIYPGQHLIPLFSFLKIEQTEKNKPANLKAFVPQLQKSKF
jgi:hypothetical protein